MPRSLKECAHCARLAFQNDLVWQDLDLNLKLKFATPCFEVGYLPGHMQGMERSTYYLHVPKDNFTPCLNIRLGCEIISGCLGCIHLYQNGPAVVCACYQDIIYSGLKTALSLFWAKACHQKIISSYNVQNEKTKFFAFKCCKMIDISLIQIQNVNSKMYLVDSI